MRGGERIKGLKVMRVLICMFVASLAFAAVNTASAAEYNDTYITGGKVVSNDTNIQYQITKSDNTTSVKWNRSISTDGAVGIQRYTVLAQDKRPTDYRLSAINKYTGNNRWSMKLDQSYTRLQFMGGKYAILMNNNKFIQLNLYTHRIVTGKTLPEPVTKICLIKSKKNGNYYVMTTLNDTVKFYKLRF